MILYSFDPGLSTGWAKFEGTIISEVGTTKWESPILHLINSLQADLFVIEDFLLRKDQNTRWAKLESVQVIGALKAKAYQLGIPAILQQPNVKPVAYAWMGGKYEKGKKGQHHLDAVAHGNYYLVKNKLKLPGT